jgi:hypothetical protein
LAPPTLNMHDRYVVRNFVVDFPRIAGSSKCRVSLIILAAGQVTPFASLGVWHDVSAYQSIDARFM